MCRPEPTDHSGDPARDGTRCRCYNAVMRAYDALIKDHETRLAREAALRVYRHHHPEDCATLAQLTVERWVNGGVLH